MAYLSSISRIFKLCPLPSTSLPSTSLALVLDKIGEELPKLDLGELPQLDLASLGVPPEEE